MMIRIAFVLMFAACCLSVVGAEPTLAEKIYAGYARIESVSCRVRKTSTVDGKTVTMLSQVYYQRPDRLHVENISPIRRRIMSDGSRFYLHQEGMPKGYSVPLERLEGEWKIMQKSVPGTPMEHLIRLLGVPEIALTNGVDGCIRRGYEMPKVFAVLVCDQTERLTGIQFYKTADMTEKTAEIQYSDFQAVGADAKCWLAAVHQATAFLSGSQVRETRRFDSLQINKPLTPGLFDAGAFFGKIEFADDFKDLTVASDKP